MKLLSFELSLSVFTKRLNIDLIFAWYDIWIGLFIDKPKQKIYLFFVPFLGIVIYLSENGKKTVS